MANGLPNCIRATTDQQEIISEEKCTNKEELVPSVHREPPVLLLILDYVLQKMQRAFQDQNLLSDQNQLLLEGQNQLLLEDQGHLLAGGQKLLPQPPDQLQGGRRQEEQLQQLEPRPLLQVQLNVQPHAALLQIQTATDLHQGQDRDLQQGQDRDLQLPGRPLDLKQLEDLVLS